MFSHQILHKNFYHKQRYGFTRSALPKTAIGALGDRVVACFIKYIRKYNCAVDNICVQSIPEAPRQRNSMFD